MASPREIRDKGLDLAGNVLAGLPHAATGDAAERHDDVVAQVAAEAAARDAAIAVETAARIAGDLAHPGTITALTGDVTASGTGAVAAALANIPQAVLLARLAALTSDPSFNSRKLTLLADGVSAHDALTVQQLSAFAARSANAAAMVAVDVSSLTFALRIVDTYKDFFYLDVSTDRVAKPHQVFATADPTKWWVRMFVASEYWAAKPTWFVDPINGNDENEGESAGIGNALQTRSEYARRTDGQQLQSTVTVNIVGDLLAADTMLPFRPQTSVQANGATGFKIRYQGTKQAKFTGTLTGVVNRNGASNITTKLTSSWTVSSLLGLIVEGVNGTGALVRGVIVADLGGGQAQVSIPLNSGFSGEDTFATGTAITVYDGVNLSTGGSPTMQTIPYGYVEFDYCRASAWEMSGSYINMSNCFGAINCHGHIHNFTNCSMNVQLQAGIGQIGGGYCQASATQNTTLTFFLSSTVKSGTTGGLVLGGCSVWARAPIDVEMVVANHPAITIVNPDVRVSLGGNVYGSLGGNTRIVQFNAGVRNSVVHFGQIPSFGGASDLVFTDAAITGSTATLATAQVNDTNLNRVVGPAGATLNDNASQSIAHLGSGGVTTTNAATIGDAQSIAAAAVAGGVGSPAITALTSDVAATGPGAAAATIQPNAVTNAKLADMATARIKGRATAGTGDPEDLTGTQATALLDVVASATKGLAPPSGGGTANFLRADGTWTAPPGTAGAAVTSLTGDVTGSGPGATATTIANDAVTNAKAANMPAHTFKANNLGATGDPLDITGAQATAELDVFDTTHKGLAPSSGGGTSNYLRADGTWATPAGTGGGGPLTGLSGDVTTTGGGVAPATISNDAVTFAKMQNIPTQTLVGRQTAGSGSPESIGVTGGIEFDGSGNIRRSALTGDVSASAGSAGTVINPNVVTNAQLAQVPTGTLKGRTAAGTGNTSDLTMAAVKAALAISFADVSGTLAAGQFPALTGDVTTPGGSLATTLATTGVTAATYGDASHVAQVTVDVKGRITAASSPSISITAGAVSGLSTTQTGALTGDVTKPAGSGATTLANIPNDTPTAGDLLGTAIAAPGAPAAGKVRLYPDSTSLTWSAKNNAGVVTHMVKTFPSTTNQVVFAIDDDGTVHGTQVDFSNLSGVIQGTQFSLAANTLVGNNTGVTGPAQTLTPAQVRTMLGLGDHPPYLDLFFSWGTGDGNNADSTLGSSIGPGLWPFWVLPNTRNSDIPGQPYAGSAVDANLVTPSMVTDWEVSAVFTQARLEVFVGSWLPVSGGSLSFRLSLNKSVDSSAIVLSADGSGTGRFDSGVTALGGASYADGDRVGLRCLPLGMSPGANKTKFTAHLRLMA